MPVECPAAWRTDAGNTPCGNAGVGHVQEVSRPMEPEYLGLLDIWNREGAVRYGSISSRYIHVHGPGSEQKVQAVSQSLPPVVCERVLSLFFRGRCWTRLVSS